MNNILKHIYRITLIGLIVCLSPSCSEDDPLLPGNGIESAQWSEVNDAALTGQTLIYEFDAPASWTAVCNEDWCNVLTPEGPAGKSSLRVKVSANESDFGRSATVTVTVEGYAEPCLITIRQGEGFLEKGEGIYRDVNEWTYKLMAANYLWNDNITKLQLDYSLNYQQFLKSTLDGVASIDDANHDDGYWMNGKRIGYYSYIESKAPLSRTVGNRYSDSGLSIIPTILGASDNDPCGFAVKWVTPGSPAAEAGVKRGDFISTVNKIKVTRDNYQKLGNSVLNGNVTIDLNDVEFNNGVAKITPKVESVLVGKDSYTDPSIYASSVIQTSNGKKVGYLMYFGFHTDYDTQLIDLFGKYKAEGIDELIVDLRYNSGGHILSSTVLGTLIAGSQHKDKVYVKTTYNASRTADGETGEYKIGNAITPESDNAYTPISTALINSLNLKRVYIIASGTTASASELLINGMRGLDIEVNLIGTTTHGKNVGMEGWQKTFNGYNFIFYPVTFFCENAKRFRDYSNGFAPNLEIDDSTIYPGDFGTMKDMLSAKAILWASTGQMPNIAASSRSNINHIRILKPTQEMEQMLTRRKGGSLMLPKRSN